jgi:hypothetical protein
MNMERQRPMPRLAPDEKIGGNGQLKRPETPKERGLTEQTKVINQMTGVTGGVVFSEELLEQLRTKVQIADRVC